MTFRTALFLLGGGSLIYPNLDNNGPCGLSQQASSVEESGTYCTECGAAIKKGEFVVVVKKTRIYCMKETCGGQFEEGGGTFSGRITSNGEVEKISSTK
jgi:hypothetical protein